jgi:kynurenine formamidase
MKIQVKPINRLILTLGLLCTASAAQSQACKPSRWGADDEIGSANYVNPAQVLAAAKLVRKGQSHPLGIVIDASTPAFPPRSLSLQIVQPGQQNGRNLAQDFGWDVIYNDDMAQLWLGIGSQLDGLGHMGEAGNYYNCNKAVDISDISGLKRLGTDKVPPLIGRGVMLDMARHFGVTSMAGGQGIGSADIKAAARAQGVTFRQGDVILFHTGWTDAMLTTDPKAWAASEPGLTNEAFAYVASLKPMAVGADTWGVDVTPAVRGDKVFYGHIEMLMKNGVYLLETMNTGRLAREGVHEFMFVLGQARIKGTVQMLINPVAMW